MKNNKRKRYRKSLSYRRRKQQLIHRMIVISGVLVLCAITIAFIGGKIRKSAEEASVNSYESDDWGDAPKLDVQLLTPNPMSRPQKKLEEIRGIVVHYTANPGSTAQNNRDYFEGLKDGSGPKVSSHFVIGLDGEIVQCIPSSEWAYASNERNKDTLSIECCHPDESGKLNDATYQSLVELTSWLCCRFGLSEQDVIRHYDVTGKICPKYFVEHEDAWEQFRQDLKKEIEKRNS